MIDDPPLVGGVLVTGVKVTDAAWRPVWAPETPVGAFGTVVGVPGALELEALPVPEALVAVTVNVYVVPLVRPVIVIGDEPPLAVKPPVLEVTV